VIAARLRGADREHVRLVALLTGGHAVIHWYQQLYPLIIPTLKSALALDDVQVGFLSSARQVTGGSVGLPLGMLTDRHPRRRAVVLAGSILAMGVGYLVMGIWPALAFATVASLLLGLGTGGWHPTSNAVLAGKFERLRGTVLSIHGSGATVMDSIAPLVAGALLAAIHWQGLLAVQIIPAVFFAWILLRSLGPALRDEREGAPEPSRPHLIADLGELARNPALLGISFSSACMGIGRVVVLTFLPIYLQEHLGYPPAVLGLYIALLHVLGIFSQPAFGFLSDRVGRKAILVPSFIALGILYLLLGYVPAGIPLGIVIVAIGTFFYTLANLTGAAIFDVVDTRLHASSWGASSLFTQVFVLPAPIIAGAMIAPLGIGAPFALSGVLMLVGAGVLALLPMRRPGG
jgi:MFS family permease